MLSKVERLIGYAIVRGAAVVVVATALWYGYVALEDWARENV